MDGSPQASIAAATEATTAPPNAEWGRQALQRLSDITMALAEAAQRKALRLTEASEDTTPAETAATTLFTKLARCVRQIVALDARLAAGGAHSIGGLSEQSRRAAADRRRKSTARAVVRNQIEDAIECLADRSETEQLLRDLDDRLEHDDIHALLAQVPSMQIVLQLCHEFGISPPYSRMTDAELDEALAINDRTPDG